MTETDAGPDLIPDTAPDPLEPLPLLRRELHTGPLGLSSREAARRLAVYGPKEVRRTTRTSLLRELLRQLVHPLALLLWAAALLAFIATIMGLGFALCLIGPAMAVSAAGRRRAQVVGATIAIGAVGFAINFIALAWAPAAPLRFLSPFHYYAPGDALAEGAVLWPQLGILVGAGVLGILLAQLLLQRRDLAP